MFSFSVSYNSGEESSTRGESGISIEIIVPYGELFGYCFLGPIWVNFFLGLFLTKDIVGESRLLFYESFILEKYDNCLFKSLLLEPEAPI